MNQAASIEQILQQLNPAQRRAATHTYDPLMVVAGPGTGKTQLLAARVANLLSVTDTPASSILCLTFTEKAALNMRQRLTSMIGANARDVEIHTFHGLATMIIAQYQDYFWNGAIFNPISEIKKFDLLEEVLDKLPLDNYFALKWEGDYTKINEATKAIGRAKKAGLTPGKLEALATSNITYLKQIAPQVEEVYQELGRRLSFKKLEQLNEVIVNLPSLELDIKPYRTIDQTLKSSWSAAYQHCLISQKASAASNWLNKLAKNSVTKQIDFSSEIKRSRSTLELAEVYQKFNQKMLKGQYFDFDDMIIKASSAIEKNPELRAELQERFSFILVDELQDTSMAQMRLISLLIDRQYNNNIMVVGDDDQSIFKFQGAELNNMINFREDYIDNCPGAKVEVLTENYRSEEHILELSSKIIDQASIRLVSKYQDLHKDLIVSKDSHRYGAKQGELNLRTFNREDEEALMIAKAVAEEYHSNLKSNPEHTIAILARKHLPLQQIATQLLELGVPIEYEHQSNIFDYPVVQVVLEVLEVTDALANYSALKAGVVLSKTLRRKVWGIDPETLWDIAINPELKNLDWISRLRADKSTEQLLVWFDEIATICKDENAVIAIESILGLNDLTTTKPLSIFSQSSEPITHLQLTNLGAVKVLRDMAYEIHATSDQTKLTAAEILQTGLSYLKKQHTLTNTIKFDDQSNPVQIMSVHKAKGLEFGSVYLMSCVERQWRSGGGRDFTPPSNIPLRSAEEDADDFIRLMYVAITRAEFSINLSYYKSSLKGSDQTPSSILTSAGVEMPEVVENLTSEEQLSALTSDLLWPRLDKAKEIDLLREQLENFKLSATSLTSFIDIQKNGPASFFEKSILRLPRVKTTKEAVGTAMHAMLETQLKELRRGKQMSLEMLQQTFKKYLKRESLSSEEFHKQLGEGVKRVNHLYCALGFTLDPNSLPEEEINAILPSGVIIGGKLDRIDIDKSRPDCLEIVDYKISKPISNLGTRDKGNNGIKALRYRLQMIFYALLCRYNVNYRKYAKVTSKFVFLHADYAKELETTYTPTEKELAEVEALINAVHNRINNLDFEQPAITGNEEAITLNDINQFIEQIINQSTSGVDGP